MKWYNHLKLDFVACLHTCKNIMLIKEVEYDLTSTLKPLFFPLSSALLQIPRERHTDHIFIGGREWSEIVYHKIFINL